MKELQEKILKSFEEKFPSHISMNHGIQEALSEAVERGFYAGLEEMLGEILSKYPVHSRKAKEIIMSIGDRVLNPIE